MPSLRTSLASALAAFALVSALAVGVAPAVHAAVDVDFGAAVPLGDDAQIYLAVAARYFDQDSADVGRWQHHCDDPDDLAVALFLSRYGHVAPERVFVLRDRGMDWWDVGVHLGVLTEAWFVPVRYNPGPPYGKAYGRYAQLRWGDDRPFALSDDEARNLVAVRLLHEYYGVTAEEAMGWRSSGRSLREIAAGAYRNRHGKGHGRVKAAGMDGGPGLSAAGAAPGHGKDKAKGKKK